MRRVFRSPWPLLAAGVSIVVAGCSAMPGGGVLIRDVSGDLYHIPAPESLDRKSRELMYSFVD